MRILDETIDGSKEKRQVMREKAKAGFAEQKIKVERLEREQ